jgi:hypothetical protein
MNKEICVTTGQSRWRGITLLSVPDSAFSYEKHNFGA